MDCEILLSADSLVQLDMQKNGTCSAQLSLNFLVSSKHRPGMLLLYTYSQVH
jgi:hypothetical protein